MSTITIKYSQPLTTVVGDPITIATNMAIFKAAEKALLGVLGDYNNKQSIIPSTSPGQFADWTVDITMPSQAEIDEQTQAMNAPNRAPSRAPSAQPSQPPMSPTVVNTAVSSSAAVGGSGDPSDMLKTTLPQCTKDLLLFIISSWKGGFDMGAYNQGMQKLKALNDYIEQLSSLTSTAIPDGVGACTTGMQIYQQLSQVIEKTYLKMPQKLTTPEVQAALKQMSEIESMNQTFSSQISSIVICFWMVMSPALKLPTAFENSTIIIKAMTQLFTDWLSGSGSTPANLAEIETLLNTIKM